MSPSAMACPSLSSPTTSNRITTLQATVSALRAQVSTLETKVSDFEARSAAAGEAAGVRSAAELLERAILDAHSPALLVLLPRDIRTPVVRVLKKLKKIGSDEALALAERIRETAAEYGLAEEGLRALLLLREVTDPTVHAARLFASADEVKAAIARAFGDADLALRELLASDVDLWFPAYVRARASAA